MSCWKPMLLICQNHDSYVKKVKISIQLILKNAICWQKVETKEFWAIFWSEMRWNRQTSLSSLLQRLQACVHCWTHCMFLACLTFDTRGCCCCILATLSGFWGTRPVVKVVWIFRTVIVNRGLQVSRPFAPPSFPFCSLCVTRMSSDLEDWDSAKTESGSVLNQEDVKASLGERECERERERVRVCEWVATTTACPPSPPPLWAVTSPWPRRRATNPSSCRRKKTARSCSRRWQLSFPGLAVSNTEIRTPERCAASGWRTAVSFLRQTRDGAAKSTFPFYPKVISVLIVFQRKKTSLLRS